MIKIKYKRVARELLRLLAISGVFGAMFFSVAQKKVAVLDSSETIAIAPTEAPISTPEPTITPTPYPTWSCDGKMGTTVPEDGKYIVASFGCWTDARGNLHEDGGDNCVPGGIWELREAGMCKWGWSGKECEQHINYYTADGTRYPFLTKLLITNPENSKSVVAIVIDGGPACWVEQRVGMPVLDVSVPVAIYLFGSSRGWSDGDIVHVEVVDTSTPLGPYRPTIDVKEEIKTNDK